MYLYRPIQGDRCVSSSVSGKYNYITVTIEFANRSGNVENAANVIEAHMSPTPVKQKNQVFNNSLVIE